MKHIKERKEFLKTEGIKKSASGFEFDWLNDNPDDVMPLKYKKYRGRVMKIGDTTYSFYHAYELEKSEYSTELMKSLKMLEGNPRDLDQVINKAVIGFDNVFGLQNYDTIITPESSSLILSKIASTIENKSGVANLFTDAFVKSASTDIHLDMDKVNALPEKTKKEVLRAFTKATDPSKPFKIKEIFSAHRKFFIDFLQFNTQNDRRLFNAVEGKDIILIDDYKTSGTTIKEMLRQLSDLGAAKVTVFVFIKLG
jgi:phosphoribosylpyrophosphate synthetase